MSETASNLPYDSGTEQELLGALLLKPDLLIQVYEVIQSSDLYLKAHRTIYEAILQLYNQVDAEGSLDSVRVIQYLQDKQELESVGGASYIQSLPENVVTPHNAPVHARRLHNLSIRRQLILAAEKIREEAALPGDDEGSFLRQVEEDILKITSSDIQHGILSIVEVKQEFKEYLQSLIESKGRPQGTITGFDRFDQLTSGLKGGQLIVLAARPGIGKTTLALNMAANVASLGQAALIFSLEMSNLELMMRLVCSEARFSNSDLQHGNIPSSQQQQLASTINTVSAMPLYIDDSGDLTIWDCMSRTRKFMVDMDQKKQSVGLIIIDYLQLMTDPEARKLGRQQEVATISRSLKQLAKAVNVPILALSQMNRSVEQRRGDYARPQLSDLRESGAIEQDADIVMFLHDDMKTGDPNDPQKIELKGTIEMIIAKHRSGATDSFRLLFEPKYNRFDNDTITDTSGMSVSMGASMNAAF